MENKRLVNESERIEPLGSQSHTGVFYGVPKQ